MIPLAELLIVLRWWLALLLVGAVATPIAWAFFGGRGQVALPSLGYTLAKPLGLLIVSYLFWLLGSLGFLANTLGGVLFALLLLLLIAVVVQRRGGRSLRATLAAQWRFMLFVELLFLLLLLFWAWMRAQNPAIAFTEKPMEFAFLNSVLRSPSFPPLDPWLSGYAISYYYFGYVMSGVIARLAAVEAAFAFNLSIAWLGAATGVGVFSLIYDLIGLHGRRSHSARRAGLILGLIGVLAVTTAGNLEIVAEVAHANGVGSAEFWQWLDVRDINTAPDPTGTPRYETTSWWWWRSSRPINETHLSGRSEEGLAPIAEVPGFSFALGDVHPHVLALPFALLSLAVALTWFLRGPSRIGDAKPLLLLTALVIGGLSFLNTWDVLIHLFVLTGAFALAQWRAAGEWQAAIAWRSLLFAVGVGVLGYLLYLPFYSGFSSQAGPPFILPLLLRPTRLPQFLIIFGMPLLAITPFVLLLLLRQRGRFWRRGVVVVALLLLALLLLLLTLSAIVATSPAGYGTVLDLARDNGISLTELDAAAGAGERVGWGLSAVAQLLPLVALVRLRTLGVTLLLAFLIGSSVAIASRYLERDKADGPPAVTPFVLLLILTGALLTLGPEYVYLKDQFGQRLNTIFKFYYQAWLFWGVAAVFAVYVLGVQRRRATQRIGGLLIGGGYLVLLSGALLFPFYMAQWAGDWYGREATLDGLAFVRDSNPDEWRAIEWLRQHAGNAVVLEAVGDAYSDYGRVSARSGVPTVLGWANHERQWRGAEMPEPGNRDPIVDRIYTQPDWIGIPDLLNEYDVRYIYVGTKEREQYGEQGLEKFAQQLEVAYQNDTVTIYAYRPN